MADDGLANFCRSGVGQSMESLMGPKRDWARTEWKGWKKGYVAYDGWTDGVRAQRAKRVLSGPNLTASDLTAFSLAHEFLLTDQFAEYPDTTGARQRTSDALYNECQVAWERGNPCKHFRKDSANAPGMYVVETPVQIELVEAPVPERTPVLPCETQTVRSPQSELPRNVAMYTFCDKFASAHQGLPSDTERKCLKIWVQGGTCGHFPVDMNAAMHALIHDALVIKGKQAEAKVDAGSAVVPVAQASVEPPKPVWDMGKYACDSPYAPEPAFAPAEYPAADDPDTQPPYTFDESFLCLGAPDRHDHCGWCAVCKERTTQENRVRIKRHRVRARERAAATAEASAQEQ